MTWLPWQSPALFPVSLVPAGQSLILSLVYRHVRQVTMGPIYLPTALPHTPESNLAGWRTFLWTLLSSLTLSTLPTLPTSGMLISSKSPLGAKRWDFTVTGNGTVLTRVWGGVGLEAELNGVQWASVGGQAGETNTSYTCWVLPNTSVN
jgi:hypothetical protein